MTMGNRVLPRTLVMISVRYLHISLHSHSVCTERLTSFTVLFLSAGSFLQAGYHAPALPPGQSSVSCSLSSLKVPPGSLKRPRYIWTPLTPTCHPHTHMVSQRVLEAATSLLPCYTQPTEPPGFNNFIKCPVPEMLGFSFW